MPYAGDAVCGCVQQLRVDIEAPVAQVWAAVATSEGFRTWAAPVAQVDLRQGGMIEASYSMQARIGGFLRSTHSSQARFISALRLMSVM